MSFRTPFFGVRNLLVTKIKQFLSAIFTSLLVLAFKEVFSFSFLFGLQAPD